MISQRVTLFTLLFSHFFVTDGAVPRFGPTCSFPSLESGYELWSNPATWAGMFSSVPGTGHLENVSVTIPCGRKIMLDVKDIRLRTLDIQGALKVQDDWGLYSVTADHVIVQGQFKIGLPGHPFRSKIAFTLTNSSGQSYIITRSPLANPLSAPAPTSISIGDKVFAVVGGRVLFYGIGPAVPTWVLLNQTAAAGANSLVVGGDVSRWPKGATIGLTTTHTVDTTGTRNEYVKIVSVKALGGQQAQIVFDKPLQFEHKCERKSVPGSARIVDQCGAVALLSRNIVVKGSPDPLQGGHFIVAFTSTPQHIQGVEFTDMGQQGILGRYPLHFHMGVEGNGTLVSKNSIHTCKQRCYVIHGTSNLRFVDNVCFKSFGIGFSIEDGIEKNNLIEHNLVSGLEVPKVMINNSQEVLKGAITDNIPSGIWGKNPSNHFVDNYINGASIGIWHDLIHRVMGPSSALQGATAVYPLQSVMGAFRGNTVCVQRICARIYPFFTAPAGTDPVLENLNIWGCGLRGIDFREVHGMTIKNCTISDFFKGINLAASSNIKVLNSLLVRDFVPKAPTPPTGYPACKIPPTSASFWYRMGVLLNTEQPIHYGLRKGVTIDGCFFAGFQFDCLRPSAAIGVLSLDPIVARLSDRAFPASNVLTNTGFDASTDAFWFQPKNSPAYDNPLDNPYTYSVQINTQPAFERVRGAAIADEYFTKMWTINGTQAPIPAACVPHPKIIQGLFCAGVCMRGMYISWAGTIQPGVVVGSLKRMADGAVATLRSYRWDKSGNVTSVVNLMGGTYELRRTVFADARPTITYFDSYGLGECDAKVNIIAV